jgi:CubicO group peptidase (beta-lactamase class C family)
MRTVLISFAILLIIVPCSAQEKDTQIEQRIQRIENGLVELSAPSFAAIFQKDNTKTAEKMVLSERMAFYQVPGVSIAVINDYKVEWTKGYGVIKVGSDAPVNPETLFEAASTTKLLSSVIVLRSVEQGQLDLDEDVNKYLKSWKIPENEFTQEEKVTLRRLLTHQSGINRPEGGFDEEEGSVPSLLNVLKGEAPAKNQAAVVEYVPGSKHQYSNMGYLVIQLLLEDVMGKPYQQIVEETIFELVGMKNSTLIHPLKPELQKRWAMPHDQEGKAHDRPQSPTALAHAGLATTPADLALFALELMRTYLGQSEGMLSQKTVQQMFSVEKELDPSQLFGISAQALGVFLMGKGQNLYFLYAGHNAPGATSVLIASPVTGKGAVVMTNGVAGLQLSLEILPAIANEYGWRPVQ